jgi:GH24 family phage-related lysozyme (muramidase)
VKTLDLTLDCQNRRKPCSEMYDQSQLEQLGGLAYRLGVSLSERQSAARRAEPSDRQAPCHSHTIGERSCRSLVQQKLRERISPELCPAPCLSLFAQRLGS